jgi:transcriptional regulator with XRE-family HTH domain
MAGNTNGNPATYFGRQLRKERLARGWSVHEFANRSGISAGHVSRIENGHRPPTEAIALVCDNVFPERKGWFCEYYEESKSWVPAGFRSWAEYEDKASRLSVWSPGIIHGLVQTADYARAVLSVSPGVDAEVVTSRLGTRMERQRRVLTREDPPAVLLIVDQFALYREVGSPEVMAGQLDRLAEVAAMPSVTLTVMPAVIHPANESEFIIADSAAYAEHVVGGYVFTDEQTVSRLTTRFDSLRAESYRASESLAMIERLGETWASGGNPLTAAATADRA